MMSIQTSRSRTIWTVVIVIVLLAGVLGTVGWYYLFRVVPTPYDSLEDYSKYLTSSVRIAQQDLKKYLEKYLEEHFKYGSIVTEQAEGIPYWIWLVLPRMFPEYLP